MYIACCRFLYIWYCRKMYIQSYWLQFGDTISFERLGKRIKGIFIGFGLSINPRLTNSIEVIVKAFNEKEKNYSTNPDTIKLEEKSTLLNKVFIVSYSGELPSLKGFNKHTIAISKTEAIKTVFDQHIGPQNDGESKDPLDCNKIFYKGGYFKAEKL